MSIPTKHSFTCLVGLAVPLDDGGPGVGDGTGLGVLVTGDRVGLGVLVTGDGVGLGVLVGDGVGLGVLVGGDGVGSGVPVVGDRIGALVGDLVRETGVVGRTLEGEVGVGVGTASDVGRIAVGDGGSDGRLGSLSAVSIAL